MLVLRLNFAALVNPCQPYSIVTNLVRGGSEQATEGGCVVETASFETRVVKGVVEELNKELPPDLSN